MKKTDRILYESKLKGKYKSSVTIEKRGASEVIKINTGCNVSPGKTNEWLSEELLLSYTSSAFMKAFLILAEQHDIAVTAYECDAIGDAVIDNKVPELISINLYPKIYIKKAESLKPAKLLIELSMKNNPAEKLFPAMITYHPVIEVKAEIIETHNEKREVFF